MNSREGSRGERSGGRAWPEQRAAGGGEWLPMKLAELLCGPEGQRQECWGGGEGGALHITPRRLDVAPSRNHDQESPQGFHQEGDLRHPVLTRTDAGFNTSLLRNGVSSWGCVASGTSSVKWAP